MGKDTEMMHIGKKKKSAHIPNNKNKNKKDPSQNHSHHFETNVLNSKLNSGHHRTS